MHPRFAEVIEHIADGRDLIGIAIDHFGSNALGIVRESAVAAGKIKATATTAITNASDTFLNQQVLRIGRGYDIAIPPPYDRLIMN